MSLSLSLLSLPLNLNLCRFNLHISSLYMGVRGFGGPRPWIEEPRVQGLGLRVRGLGLTLRILPNWGTSKCRISETPKRPKGSP